MKRQRETTCVSLIDAPLSFGFQFANLSAIPILQKHLNFVVEQHSKYEGGERQPKPDALGELFSTAWTRNAISAIVGKGTDHITEVSTVRVYAQEMAG